MWELDHKEGWALKNWCFWTVVVEKTLESPLDCKEIKPVNPKGNPPWIFTGRTDAKSQSQRVRHDWVTEQQPYRDMERFKYVVSCRVLWTFPDQTYFNWGCWLRISFLSELSRLESKGPISPFGYLAYFPHFENAKRSFFFSLLSKLSSPDQKNHPHPVYFHEAPVPCA